MGTYKVIKITTTIDVAENIEANNESEAQVFASSSFRNISTNTLHDVTKTSCDSDSGASIKNKPTNGFGFYLRKIANSESDALALLERMKTCEATWVAFMVEDMSGNIQDLNAIRTYSKALISGGVKCWVWTFPGEDTASSVVASTEAAKRAVSYCKEIDGLGIILDIEAAYKGKSVQLNALVDTALLETENTDLSVGIVSYPIPSYHSTLDWTVLSKCDWGSPMLYNSAGSVDLINKCINEWSLYGIKDEYFVPSLATYDTDSPGNGAEQLNGDIERVLDIATKSTSVIFWSEVSTSNEEREVIFQQVNKRNFY